MGCLPLLADHCCRVFLWGIIGCVAVLLQAGRVVDPCEWALDDSAEGCHDTGLSGVCHCFHQPIVAAIPRPPGMGCSCGRWLRGSGASNHLWAWGIAPVFFCPGFFVLKCVTSGL